MHILRAADRKPTAWKNGGGLTWEVAAWPPGASLDDFEWRASIAEVSSSGPFSVFSGIDRVLTVLAGPGLELNFEGRAPIRLDAASAPFAFAGDACCDAVLIGGAVRDFNMMARRGQWSVQVQRRQGPMTLHTHTDLTLILACSPIRIDAVDLDPDDVVLVEGSAEAGLAEGSVLVAELTRA
ncbi:MULTISPECIES: HutD family protein [unclassified Phenylobacterium]|uniref:HutD/Ves family protein n=1 Tax=unclassified Phenylobacterium TaxID=2640670 RepID=UPI0022B2C126|nr:HutD family protein [Phenylobacterium sp. NIBR 498073]MBS0490042.1 HutD family protein [Pseudomonadota bacterium]WGU39078.1 HutD family protein [Phenylobacterium sp. NIBR 498073]